MSLKQIILLAYGGYLILLSLLTFILYYADKKKAEKKKWRIPEKVLLLSSFLGGAFGGYPAMLIFRHKTKGEHWYFTFINILGILIHIAALVAIAFFIKFE
ncbi:MAG: DUF1294 domain-containing protein [Bacilli bacterium]|nr:DUF1294 domain-containing protein [Bacilli bacterium]